MKRWTEGWKHHGVDSWMEGWIGGQTGGWMKIWVMDKHPFGWEG